MILTVLSNDNSIINPFHISVVRELDCLLRRGSIFTRKTGVSAALQWIEDCMAAAQWWVHIQSTAEEARLVPPTPPSTPHWFGEGKGASSLSSNPFSPYSLQEIVTPTAADHILEYTLFVKRTRNDGQVVLLSDDLTLKIKAMAEVRKPILEYVMDFA